jgi:hypothetical protein
MYRESKQAEWSERMAAFAASGLSGKRWCEQNGINMSVFAYWRRKLKELEAGPAWCAVQVAQEAKKPGAAAGRLTVSVGPAQIQIEPDFDPQLLRAVVHALAGTGDGTC